MSIRGAIAKWVRETSGLAVGKVYWAKQRGAIPSGTCISMTLEGETSYGQDWTSVRDAAAPVPGADIEIVLTGPRVSRLVLECYIGDQDWETVQPDKILSRVVASRNLPGRAAELRAAGVGFGPVGPIQPLNIERAQIFDPRVRVELAIHTISEVSELGTWIETTAVEPFVDDVPLAQVNAPVETSTDRVGTADTASSFVTGGERIVP